MNAILPPPEIIEALRRMGLATATPLTDTPVTDTPVTDTPLTGEPLTGGVSSDIWRINLPGGPICVKRALAKLRVAADWRAPVGRNRYEAR